MTRFIHPMAMALFVLFRADNLLIILDEPEVHFNDVWKREIVHMLDQINLDRYMPPPGDQPQAETSAGTSGTTTKKEKTDYTPLRRMILNGTAKIGRLTVSNAKVQEVLLQIKAKDGIFKLDPMKLKMYQGNTTGKVVLNVAKNTPRSNLKLRINDVQVNPLLKDVLEQDFLEGLTNADIKLSMVGDAPEQIKKTLNGKGDLRFNDGATFRGGTYQGTGILRAGDCIVEAPTTIGVANDLTLDLDWGAWTLNDDLTLRVDKLEDATDAQLGDPAVMSPAI